MDGALVAEMGRVAYFPQAARVVAWQKMAGLQGPGFDPHTWYSDEELKECPYCGERAAVPRGEGPSVCLSCEVVWIDGDGEKDGAGPQTSDPA